MATLVYLFNKTLLSTYYRPGTVLDTELFNPHNYSIKYNHYLLKINTERFRHLPIS